jgi:Zn-dependent peptidase ImmA (M78 family)
LQFEWETPGKAFASWRTLLESYGVVVLQLGIGKGNIRGFSAWDPHAPLVVVNTAYNVTARIFTLFHEVGHLLTRTDAACFRFILPTGDDHLLERWCERFAASLLVPADALERVSTGFDPSGRIRDVDTAQKIANRFKVSTRAIALRLQELGFAPSTLYGEVERAFSDLDWNTRGGGGGGEAAPARRLRELGRRATETLLHAGAAGRLTRRDLADYLRLTTGQLTDLESLVGAGV